MALENTQEYPSKPEGLRKLISTTARTHLEVLGYAEVLIDADEWLMDNDHSDFLNTLVGNLKRIPRAQDAKGLLIAALFGIPMGGDKDPSLLLSYSIAEISEIRRQTEFDPNRDSKDKEGFVPNTAGTKILAGRIADTGFLKPGQVPMHAIRKLSWGKKPIYTDTNDRLEITITPPKKVPLIAKIPAEWAYKIEVRLMPS